MKIKQAISLVKSENQAFSDDTNLTDRFIWNKILTKSKLFIKQKNDSFKVTNNNFFYTTIDCLEMELVDSISCCQEIPNCKILKSKHKLPKIVESNSSSVIRGIYTLDGGKRIDLVTINDVIRLSNSRYKPNDLKAFIKNEYLFIPFKEYPKAITIEAYFEDPMEVLNLNSCNLKDTCISPYDLEWKVPSDLETVIIQEVNKELLNFFHRIIPDENTDKNNQSK